MVFKFATEKDCKMQKKAKIKDIFSTGVKELHISQSLIHFKCSIANYNNLHGPSFSINLYCSVYVVDKNE